MPKVKTLKLRKASLAEPEDTLAVISTKKKPKLALEAPVVESPEPAIVDPFHKFYVNRLDSIEKQFGLSSGVMEQGDRLSTGMLVTDLILSGGLAPRGMVSFAGPEASSKSTLSTHIFGSALKAGMLSNYHDPEGSLDPVYSTAILRVNNLEEVFGRKDKDGKWVVLPKARYYDNNTLETFFNFNKEFLMSLPDKAYIAEHDKWYYVFKPDRDGIKAKIDEMGLKIDKELYKTTQKYYCETQKRGAQAVIFCDSWPSLLSEDQDQEDKERSKAMAFNARKFSEYLPQVIGKLRRKSVIVSGVNQIRVNPMAYGNPNYEPGGNALKFNCMTAGTYIFTEKGIVRADFYTGEYKIASKDGSEVSGNFTTMGVKEIAMLTLSNGLTIKASVGHSVYTYDSNQGGLKYKQLSDLNNLFRGYVAYKIGSEVWSDKNYVFNNSAFVEHANVKNKCKYPSTMSIKLARLLGFLVGDGSISGGYITYTTGHKKEVKEVQALIKLCFGIMLPIQLRDKTYCISTHNSRLGAWLRYNGFEHHGRDKDIPDCILRSTKPVIISFVSGLMDADGCSSGNISISSISHKIVQKLQLIMHNAGIDTIISQAKSHAWGKTYDRYIYKLNIRDSSAIKFFETVPVVRLYANRPFYESVNCRNIELPKMTGWAGLNSQVIKWIKSYQGTAKLKARKTSFYKEAEKYRTLQQRVSIKESLDSLYEVINLIDSGVRFCQINNIEFNFAQEMTYDGTMPESHTIITNGIVSHNSSVRMQLFAKTVPHDVKKQIEEEPAVWGRGTDSYAYKYIKNTKNKQGTPYLDGWVRVWVRDAAGQGRGYCYVWDQYQYYLLTGRIEGKRNKFKIVGVDGIPADKVFTWLDFKKYVLAETKSQREEMAKFIGRNKYTDMRKQAFAEMREGQAMKLYNKHAANKSKNAGVEDLEE